MLDKVKELVGRQHCYKIGLESMKVTIVSKVKKQK